MNNLDKLNVTFQNTNYSFLEKLSIIYQFLNYNIDYNRNDFYTKQNIKIYIYDKKFRYFKTIKYLFDNEIVRIKDIKNADKTRHITIIHENDLIFIWNIKYIESYKSLIITVTFTDYLLTNIYTTLFSQFVYNEIYNLNISDNMSYVLRENIPLKLRGIIINKIDYINDTYNKILKWLEPRLLIEIKM